MQEPGPPAAAVAPVVQAEEPPATSSNPAEVATGVQAAAPSASSSDPQQPVSSQPAAEAAEAAIITQDAEQPPASSSNPEPRQPYNDALLKEFFTELREVDRDNEVNRILWAFKLNPYEQLNLRFDASLEEVRRQYRKASLMVHPDKCKHPQASAAFEVLGKAQKELMDDAKREVLHYALGVARDEVRKERSKEVKHDTAVRLASVLHEAGRQGVESEWEKTDEFHERWKAKARQVLANSEWRKRKLSQRIASEEKRLEEETAEEREEMKRKRENEAVWEKTREQRVGSWHDFAKKQKDKGKMSVGGIKPPQLKTSDADKLYVQRPAGEHFRPPPPKNQQPPPRR